MTPPCGLPPGPGPAASRSSTSRPGGPRTTWSRRRACSAPARWGTRHARPRRHRRARARRRSGDPPAAVPVGARQALRRRGRAGRRHDHARRLRRGRRHLGHVGGRPRRRAPGGGRADRRDRPGAPDGLGEEGRGTAAARAGGRASRSSARRCGCGSTASRSASPSSGVYPIEVTCSAGTYVRSLAADLGAALGGGAHLQLRRLAVRPFTIEEAVPLEQLARRLLPRSRLPGRPRATVTTTRGAGAQRAGAGGGRPRRGAGQPGHAPSSTRPASCWRYVRQGDTLKPAVVLATG